MLPQPVVMCHMLPALSNAITCFSHTHSLLLLTSRGRSNLHNEQSTDLHQCANNASTVFFNKLKVILAVWHDCWRLSACKSRLFMPVSSSIRWNHVFCGHFQSVAKEHGLRPAKLLSSWVDMIYWPNTQWHLLAIKDGRSEKIVLSLTAAVASLSCHFTSRIKCCGSTWNNCIVSLPILCIIYGSELFRIPSLVDKPSFCQCHTLSSRTKLCYSHCS